MISTFILLSCRVIIKSLHSSEHYLDAELKMLLAKCFIA